MIKYRKLKNLLIWKCKQKKVATQLPTATRMAELEEVEPPVPLVLLPCTSCNRTFRPEALAKHAKVCEKTLMKKRKKFDSARQRLQGTDVPQFPPPPSQKESPLKPIAQSKWREKQAEIARSLHSVRKKSDGGASLLVKPSDQEQCPFCERSFGPKAYDRHTEWCKEQQAKLKNNTVNTEARERLQVRTKYRAPLSHKVLTRDKYLPRSRDPSPMGLSKIEAEDRAKQKLPSPLNRSQSMQMNGRSRSLIAKSSTQSAELRNSEIRSHASSTNVRTRDVPRSPKEPERAATTTHGDNVKPRIISNNNNNNINQKKVPVAIDREAELRKCRSWTSQAFLDPNPNPVELQVHSCILHPITVKRSQEGSLSLSDQTRQSSSVSRSCDVSQPTYVIDRFATPGPCLLQADRLLRDVSPDLFLGEQDDDGTSEVASDNFIESTNDTSVNTKLEESCTSQAKPKICSGRLKNVSSFSGTQENTSIIHDSLPPRRFVTKEIKSEYSFTSARAKTVDMSEIVKSEITDKFSQLETDSTVQKEELDTTTSSETGTSHILDVASWKSLPLVLACDATAVQSEPLAIEYRTTDGVELEQPDDEPTRHDQVEQIEEDSENSDAESGQTWTAHADILKSVADEYMAWYQEADAQCSTNIHCCRASDSDSQLTAEECQDSFFLDLSSFIENSATSECVYTENVDCHPRVVRIEGIVEINEVGTTVDDLEDFIKQSSANLITPKCSSGAANSSAAIPVVKHSFDEKSAESVSTHPLASLTIGSSESQPSRKPKISTSCHSFGSRSKSLPKHQCSRSVENIGKQPPALVESDGEDKSSYIVHDQALPEPVDSFSDLAYVTERNGSSKTLNDLHHVNQSDDESIDTHPLSLEADEGQSTIEEEDSRMDQDQAVPNTPTFCTEPSTNHIKNDVLGEPKNGKIHTLNDLIAFVLDAKSSSVSDFPKNVLNYNVANVSVLNEFHQDLMKLINDKMPRGDVDVKTGSVQVDLPCPVCQKCKNVENKDDTAWTTLALEADYVPKYSVEVDVSVKEDSVDEGHVRVMSQDDGSLDSSDWEMSSCSCASSEKVTDKKVLRKKTVKYYETIEYRDTKTGPSTIKTSVKELPPLKNAPKYVVAKTTKKEIKPILPECDQRVMVQEDETLGAGEDVKLPPIKRRFERRLPCDMDKYDPFASAEQQMLELFGAAQQAAAAQPVPVVSPEDDAKEPETSSSPDNIPSSAFAIYTPKPRRGSLDTVKSDNAARSENKENLDGSTDGALSPVDLPMDKNKNFSLSNLSLCSIISIDSVDCNRNPIMKSYKMRDEPLHRSASAVEGKHGRNRVKVNMQQMLYGFDSPGRSTSPRNCDVDNLEACEAELIVSMMEFEKMLNNSPIPTFDQPTPSPGNVKPNPGSPKSPEDDHDSKSAVPTSVDSAYSSLTRASSGDGDSAKMDPPKFCHECGTKYPVPMAKFCCNCGIRRIAI